MGKITSYPYNPSGSDTKSIEGIMSIFDQFKEVINGLEDTNLAEAAKNLFPQLISSLLGAKIAFGVAEANFPGGSPFSEYVEIEHGTEADEPKVWVTAGPNASWGECSGYLYDYPSSKKMRVRLHHDSGEPPKNTKIKFFWLAIG